MMGLSWVDMSRVNLAGPALVEPKKYRYFPPGSKVGQIMSAMRSDTGKVCPVSTRWITACSRPLVRVVAKARWQESGAQESSSHL
ncbi:MAG: hypothetical protein BWY88_01347 [Synergistetes bacterium ADurb.Bin520]|nr:MAG: hypothetical protein BWY88_01347 [Synergistetes bacterium ADurb.Bin520]